ncbi:MAG: hypothetical protein ABIN61_01455 [candidate division WOR-3 bacterium]
MMKETLKKIATIEGVFSCFLVDKEGEVIDYYGNEGLDPSIVAAAVASVSVDLSTQMNIPEDFSITVLAEEKNLFIITQKNFILAVFTKPSVDTGKIRFEIKRGAKVISKEL